MYSSVYTPSGPGIYFTTVAVLTICGALAFSLLHLYSRAAIWFVSRFNYRHVSAATLVLLLGVVGALTGPGGLAIAFVGAMIGAIPILWGSRRMNCLGILLLPITLNMAGLGPTVAGWLGII